MAKAKADPMGSVSDEELEKITGSEDPLRSLSEADLVRLANSDRRSDSWQRGMEYGGLFGLTTGATGKDMTSALARFADGAFGGAVENTMQFPMATAIGGLPLAQMYSGMDATAAMSSNGRFDPINQKAPPPIQEFLDNARATAFEPETDQGEILGALASTAGGGINIGAAAGGIKSGFQAIGRNLKNIKEIPERIEKSMRLMNFKVGRQIEDVGAAATAQKNIARGTFNEATLAAKEIAKGKSIAAKEAGDLARSQAVRLGSQRVEQATEEGIKAVEDLDQEVLKIAERISEEADLATLDSRDLFIKLMKEKSDEFGERLDELLGAEGAESSLLPYEVLDSLSKAMKEGGFTKLTATSTAEKHIADWHSKLEAQEGFVDAKAIFKDLNHFLNRYRGKQFSQDEHIVKLAREGITELLNTKVPGLAKLRSLHAPFMWLKNKAIKVIEPFEKAGKFGGDAGEKFFTDALARGEGSRREARFLEALLENIKPKSVDTLRELGAQEKAANAAKAAIKKVPANKTLAAKKQNALEKRIEKIDRAQDERIKLAKIIELENLRSAGQVKSKDFSLIEQDAKNKTRVLQDYKFQTNEKLAQEASNARSKLAYKLSNFSSRFPESAAGTASGALVGGLVTSLFVRKIAGRDRN